MREAVIVRPFDHSLADAEGLLDVERATFNESPYTADEVRVMLARGAAQQAWLAVGEERIIGFVVAFISAVFVVRHLLDYVSRHGFALFAWWRIIVGGLGLGALVVLG